MTGRQRLLALLHGEPTDRIGVQLRGVCPWSETWRRRQHPSFAPLIEAVDAGGDWEAMIGFDTGVFVTAADVPRREWVEDAPGHPDVEHRVAEIACPLGSLRSVVAHSRVGHPPLMIEWPVKTPTDAENILAVPYEPVRPDPAPILRLDRTVSDRGLPLVIIGSDPVGDVYNLLGTDRLAIWSIEHRNLLHRLLAESLRRKLDLVDHLANTLGEHMPLWIGHTGAELVVPPLHGPEDFRDFVTRYDSPLHERIHEHGGRVHVHCHGSLGKVLEDFAEMGADMLHPLEAPPMGDVPLADAKRRIGDRVTIEGNLQIAHVLDEEPEAFRRRVAEVIEIGKPGGRFVLCPTASPYCAELPERALANYRTIIELAHDIGRY